jgi:adenylate kinase family enzyme
MSNQLPVINLMGPTASGKTALACELYERGNFELISVDSALFIKIWILVLLNQQRRAGTISASFN